MTGQLFRFRKQIDTIDEKIFELLEKRFDIIKKIGKYKIENNLEIRNNKREEELIEREIKKARLNSTFIKEIYDLIFKESWRTQNG